MRALLLLYYFPPSGGPGVQRGVKLCRHLPAAGIEPAVVTVEPSTYDGPEEYAPDPTLTSDVPEGLRVVRAGGGEGRALRRALQRARIFRLAWHAAPRRFFERQAGWHAAALAALLAEIERGKPDVLLTSSQPYVAHLAGLAAHRRTGIPWVADFRDPWTSSWGRSWPSERAFRWETDREDEVLDAATRVVANTPGSRAELLARRPWIPAAKVDVVPNGYDPRDFDVPPAARDADSLVVVHSGAFRARPPGAERAGLRRRVDARAFAPIPFDLSTHSPAALLRALANPRVRAAPRRVTARLVGPLPEGWRRLARELGVEDRVDVAGPAPHRESIAHVLAADLLYLPTVTREDGERVSNVPAKTYEYLGSGRPIAALAGPGDVRDLLTPCVRATLLPPDDADALADLLSRRAAGEAAPASGPDPEDARPWRRDALAARMARALRAAAAPTAPSLDCR